MNEQILFLMVICLLCIVSGFMINKIVRGLVSILEGQRIKKTLPALEEIDEDKLCKGPHSYDTMKLMMSPLPTADYLICKDCGFISSSEFDFKLNGPALEVFKNNLKIRDEQKSLREQILKKRQEYMDVVMNMLIKQNIQNFDGDIHKNIPELQQFFRKSAIEIDNLYSMLNKEFEGKNKIG